MNSVPDWEGAEWFDDWYAVERIDDQTFAIGEPRYWQFVVSFLIVGDERALLFDSGSGQRDIVRVVDALTDLPVTVACSHLHFDHIGNHRSFERVAMFDHSTLRARVRDGVFTPSLGQVLKLDLPRLTVTEWWAAGSTVRLGRRQLEVIHVPGHAVESIALLDRGRGQLFLGDFLYNDMLLVEDFAAYHESTAALIDGTDGSEVLFGAHGAPRVPYSRLPGLHTLLTQVLDGSVTLRPSMADLTPQRRVVSGEVDVRLPVFGVKGILLPYLAAVLAVVALVIGLYVAVSRVAAAVVLAVAAYTGYFLHKRM